MCTATYFPFSDTNDFVLTHSRDEKAVRPAAHLPQPTLINGQSVLFPQDPQGHGTWIAATTDQTVCLLNGAFMAHQPQYPYRHSRGIVVLDFFQYANPEAFADWYDFKNLEPFTLLVAGCGRLVEIRWNGRRLFFHEKDPQRPHIWSSVTLYTPEVVEKREGWFREWGYKNREPSVADVRAFHLNAGDNDPTNSIRMNRDGKLFTVSLSSAFYEQTGMTMIYDDFSQPVFVQTLNSLKYAAA